MSAIEAGAESAKVLNLKAKVEEDFSYDYFRASHAVLHPRLELNTSERSDRYAQLVKNSNLLLESINKVYGEFESGDAGFTADNSHIRFPILRTSVQNDKDNVDISIRIRINPCCRCDYRGADSPTRSKTWVIVQNEKAFQKDSDMLVSLFRSVAVLSESIQREMRNVDSSLAEGDNQYAVKIKVASRIGYFSGQSYRNLFNTALSKSKEEGEQFIQENLLLKNIISNIIKFSDDFSGKLPDSFLEAIRFIKNKQHWTVLESQLYTSAYRFSFTKEVADVTGIVHADNIPSKSDIIFRDATDFALKASWGL